MQDISKLLGDRHIRRTRTRKRVLSLLMEEKKAFSVLDVYDRFNHQLDRVTVYRNLNFLHEQGILCKVLDSKGTARFLYGGKVSVDRPHFRCTSCGFVFNLPSLPETYLNKLKIYDIQQVILLFTGVCNGCRKERANSF